MQGGDGTASNCGKAAWPRGDVVVMVASESVTDISGVDPLTSSSSEAMSTPNKSATASCGSASEVMPGSGSSNDSGTVSVISECDEDGSTASSASAGSSVQPEVSFSSTSPYTLTTLGVADSDDSDAVVASGCEVAKGVAQDTTKSSGVQLQSVPGPVWPWSSGELTAVWDVKRRALSYTASYQPSDSIGDTSVALDWFALGKTIETMVRHI